MKKLSSFKFFRGVTKEQPNPDPRPHLDNYAQLTPVTPIMTNRYLVEFTDYPQIPSGLCNHMTPINVRFNNHVHSYDDITFSMVDTEETPIMSILMEGLNGDTRNAVTVNVQVLDATGLPLETIQVIGHLTSLESVDRCFDIDDSISFITLTVRPDIINSSICGPF